MSNNETLAKVANTIRAISAEAIQKANSGHPGLPMGCADITSVLWSEFLTVDPTKTDWINRDRFVLSAGHGSMLLYSALHLYGFDVTMEDIKNFRQLGSRTPGHPEFGYTDGVETTTGPLGQGIANAVGMALSAKVLADKFNTDAHKVIDNKIFTLTGDGCLMEGVASEAASLAGHLRLNNLVAIYDSNSITIEGSTDIAFTEDVAKRFESYGWDVVACDGHDLDAIRNSISASNGQEKPLLVIATTTIGKGAPTKSGTHKVHGAPLGPEETGALRSHLGIGTEEFSVDEEVYTFTKSIAEANKAKRLQWEETFAAWSAANPELKAEWDSWEKLEVPVAPEFPKFEIGASVASRKSSSMCLEALSPQVPNLFGGSADLDCSNLTRMPEAGDINTDQFSGRNLHFGVREHAMGAICNGMALFGMVRVYCSTFLVFSDYMRHAIRLAGLMKLPITYIFTHDSIFVGEDGPTHQPIEHKVALEVIPNVQVIRPADANEVVAAWQTALTTTDRPTALLLSRQNLETLEGPANIEKGAYVIRQENGEEADIILMASGSEVKIALDTATALAESGIDARVVSMPSATRFNDQSTAYKEEVLPSAVRNRYALDFGHSTSWYRYIGLDGVVQSIDTFGECGPGAQVADHFGFTAEKVTAKVKDYLNLVQA